MSCLSQIFTQSQIIFNRSHENKMQSKHVNNFQIKYKITKKQIKLSKAIKSINLRYLIVGALNTTLGYILANLLYYTLQNKFNLISISIFSNILLITISFLNYKLLVFKTRGNWLSEYRNFYILYGANAILGISILWVFVDLLGIPFWIAQGLILLLSIILLYIGHVKFTFVSARLTK